MKETGIYKNILKEELSKRCERNASYSIRSFAKSLELDAGALSRILSGKQIPSMKVVERLLSKLDLSHEQKEVFLKSVAEVQRQRGLQRLAPAFKRIEGRLAQKDLSIDLYRVIADWYHVAILEMTLTKNFQSNVISIAKQLGISRTETKLALERLLDLGLLKLERGRLIKTDVQLSTTDKHLTTPALRKNQKQFLEKAIASLDQDPIEKRSHTSMTMAIDPSKMNQAKKLIRDFNKSMCELLESGEQKQVYNLQIALYPLQVTGD
jgi:uncharacterized protein (TIGR02147 family)